MHHRFHDVSDEYPFDDAPLSRRQFVKLSAATGGVLALPGAASADGESDGYETTLKEDDDRTYEATLPTGDTVIAHIEQGQPVDLAMDTMPRDDGTVPGYIHIDDGESIYVIPDEAGTDPVHDREDFDVLSILGIDHPLSDEQTQSSSDGEDAEHELTVEATDFRGEPFDGTNCSFAIINLHDRDEYSETCPTFEDGAFTDQVPQGTYAVVGIDRIAYASGASLLFMGDPDVHVDDDTTVTLNGKQAEKVDIDLEDVDAIEAGDAEIWPREKGIGFMIAPEEGLGYKNQHSIWGMNESSVEDMEAYNGRVNHLYVKGFDSVPNVGEFRLGLTWQLDTPNRGVGGYEDPSAPESDGPPTHYFIPFSFDEPIETGPSFEVLDDLDSDDPDDVTVLPTPIHSNTEESSAIEADDDHYREFHQNWIFHPADEGSFARINHVSVPVERVDVLAAEEFYSQSVSGDPNSFSSLSNHAQMQDPGDQPEESWFAEPLAPGLIPIEDQYHRDRDVPEPTTRGENTFSLEIPEILDAEGHAGWAASEANQVLNQVPAITAGNWPGITTDFSLYIDGSESPQTLGERNSQGTFLVPEAPATYGIHLETQADSGYGTWAEREFETSTTWTFDSQAPENGDEEPLPMLTADLDLTLDVHNELPAEQDTEIQLDVRHQPGIETPIADASLEVSYDEGDTWTDLDLDGDTGTYTATLTPPAEATTLSLCVTAVDADGNQLEQEMIRIAGIR